MKASEIARDLMHIRATLLMGRLPFLATLLHRARVVATKAVRTLGVDERTTVYVNPDFWNSLDTQQKAYLICHEIAGGHAAFLHPLRERSINPEKDGVKHLLANLAGDAKVYQNLEELISCPSLEEVSVKPETIANLTGVPEERVRKMSMEQIFHLLSDSVEVRIVHLGARLSGEGGGITISVRTAGVGETSPSQQPTPEDVGAGGDEGEEDGEGGGEVQMHDDLVPGLGADGEVIQEGDPSLRGARSPDEIRGVWREFVLRAYSAQKTAGTVPAGLERAISELIKPKISVKALLRVAIQHGLGKLRASTWKKPSRKYPEVLPGRRKLTYPTIWALVDASGSISEDELKLFLGTLYEFAKEAEVRTVSFDTEAYDLVTAKRPRDVVTEVARRIKGGGGTMIENALNRTLSEMSWFDIVVVLTDGEIFDIREERVQDLFRMIARKGSSCIFCTTGRAHGLPGWRTVEL